MIPPGFAFAPAAILAALVLYLAALVLAGRVVSAVRRKRRERRLDAVIIAAIRSGTGEEVAQWLRTRVERDEAAAHPGDDELMAELAAALREVPGVNAAGDTGREAWHGRQQRGGGA